MRSTIIVTLPDNTQLQLKKSCISYKVSAVDYKNIPGLFTPAPYRPGYSFVLSSNKSEIEQAAKEVLATLKQFKSADDFNSALNKLLMEQNKLSKELFPALPPQEFQKLIKKNDLARKELSEKYSKLNDKINKLRGFHMSFSYNYKYTPFDFVDHLIGAIINDTLGDYDIITLGSKNVVLVKKFDLE